MMRVAALVSASLFFSAILGAAEAPPAPASATPANAELDGRELAARLRDSVPERASELKGLLLVTSRDGKVTETPIVSKITISPTNWQVSYHAAARGAVPGETLVILHALKATNRYELQLDRVPPETPDPSRILRDEELSRPFAGSDFWVMDLGCEFFHWPQQRKLKHEMRRSRACNVLESTNPNPRPPPGSYLRVVSWIDVETGGIIRAEAYDQGEGTRPIKEFELGSLRKVDGQHQLESMKIRSRKTGQETELKFDLRTK